MKHQPQRLKPIAAAVLSVTATMAAYAEQASNPGLEEMVVKGSYVVNDRLDTATGLGLTLQETPQSVSIITFQRIEDQDLRSLTDVINYAPGVSSKAFDSSRNAFSARGFDVDNYQIDGIPVQWDGGASAGETQTDLALYERVEIVRGATGLLTGVGKPSASINLVRKHATSDEFTGFVSASVSRWDTYNATVDLSSPLNESGSVRGRTVMVYEDGNSYVDYAGNKKQVLYGVIDADVTDKLLVSVGASYQDNDPTASQWGGLPIFFSDGTRTDWDRSDTVGADWTYWATTHETYFAYLTYNLLEDWQLRVNLNRTKSTSDMRLLYLYGNPDPVTGLGMGGSPRRFNNEREQDDYGIRLSGTYNLFGRDHELVVGMDYSEQDFVYNDYERDGAADVGNFFAWDGNYPEPGWSNEDTFQSELTKETGYYAATRLSISDPLKLVLGARVVDWERTGEYYGAELDYGDSGEVVPYAGLLYDLTDNHTVYISYTEIFEPQQEQDIQGNYLDPLVGKNYEIGLKSTYFDERLHTTVTLFQTEQDNLAVEDENFDPNNDPLGQDRLVVYREADGVESDGFELEVVGAITESWSISANYTQFDATEEGPDGESNTVNTRFPRKLFRLFTTYDWERLTMGGGVSWEGSNYTDVTSPTGESVKAEQEAYALVNVMARYQVSENLSAQLNVDNLFDKTYYSQIGFYTQLAYGEPRNVSLKLKYQF